MNILFITKQKYMNKDLARDLYGRYFEIPSHLASKGLYVSIFCMDYHNREDISVEVYKYNNLVIRTYKAGRYRLAGMLKYVFAIYKSVRKDRPDIIIGGADVIQILIASFISRLNRINYLCDLYDNYESYKLTSLPFLKQLYVRALRKSSGLSVISPQLITFLKRKYKLNNNIILLENGIDRHLFKKQDRSEARKRFNLPPDKFLVGTAGALTMERGVNLLVDAFQELAAESGDYFLVLAGKLDDSIELKSSDRILYLGELDYEDIPCLYSALDLGVIYIQQDEFGKYCHPQKAGEMVACELPIVCANVGYMSDLLAGQEELLYDPVSHVDLKEKIQLQLHNRIMANVEVRSWVELSEQYYRFICSVKSDGSYESEENSII